MNNRLSIYKKLFYGYNQIINEVQDHRNVRSEWIWECI